MSAGSGQLNTYLLRGLTQFDVEELRSMDPPYFEAGRGGRGILVADFEPQKKSLVDRVLAGDNRDIVKGWLEQNAVEKLCAEYRSRGATAEEQSVALSVWRSVREERVRLQQESVELTARQRHLRAEIRRMVGVEKEATEQVVRTHGQTLMRIDGHDWALCRHEGGLQFRRMKG